MRQAYFFIRTDDVMKLKGCSQSTAYRDLDKVRFDLNQRAKSKPVTLKEYCEYYELSMEDVKAEIQRK